MECITDTIEHKDVEIKNLKEEADRLAAKVKKYYNDGIKDGSDRIWELASKIVHLKWDGHYVHPNTVEDWFDMYSPTQALAAMKTYENMIALDTKDDVYWKRDLKRNRFICPFCNISSETAYPYCPWCGSEMKTMQKGDVKE
jgi:rubrerythrin